MRLRATLIAAALLLAARAAQAQPGPWQPDRLTEGWTVTPSMVVGMLWDSNVTVRQSADPNLEEWIGLINPRGEVDYNGRYTRFNAGWSGAFERYRRFDQLNALDQRARTSLKRTLSQRLSADGRASYSHSPTTDRLELGTLPFISVGSTIADAAGGIRLRMTRQTSLTAGYRFEDVSFDRTQQPQQAAFLNGGQSHTPTVSVTQSLSQHVTVGGEYQYQYAVLEGINNTFNIQDLLGQTTYQFSKNTSFAAGAGASHLTVSQTGTSVWGPAFRGSVQHKREHLTLGAAYHRSFVPSFSFGGLTGNQDMSLSAAAPLMNGRLIVAGTTTYARTEPVKELGLGFQLTSIWYTGSVGYQLQPWLRTEGFYRSMHQTSGGGNLDAGRTRIGIQFIVSKPVRIE